MSAVTLDPATHRYAVDGRHVPGVTEILRAAGLTPSMEWVTDYALDRGRQVHAAIALDAEGALDEASVDPVVAPRLAAYRAFRAAAGARLEVVEIETPRYHEGLRFCGTLDQLVRWDGALSVLELKTGPKEKHHPLQVGGYQELVGAPTGLVLYLSSDGSYKLDTVERDARTAFLVCLQLWHVKERWGCHS